MWEGPYKTDPCVFIYCTIYIYIHYFLYLLYMYNIQYIRINIYVPSMPIDLASTKSWGYIFNYQNHFILKSEGVYTYYIYIYIYLYIYYITYLLSL